MTVNSNSSAYSSYGSSSVTSSAGRGKPNFEEMANELLSSMDSDGSGSIDKAEFSTAAQSMASGSSSSSSVSDIFSKLDADSDGSMSSQELMSALESMKPQQESQGKVEGGMPPPPPQGGMPPPSEETSSSEDSTSSDIFAALDTNEDGVISADEFQALFSKESSSAIDATSEAGTWGEQTTKDKFDSIRDDILKKVLSYYDNSISTTNSDSLLSVSA